MTDKNDLETLWDKLVLNFDYTFLERLKLPYHNVYFLVCLAEIVNKLIQSDEKLPESDNAIDFAIESASELYNRVNISSAFENDLI